MLVIPSCDCRDILSSSIRIMSLCRPMLILRRRAAPVMIDDHVVQPLNGNALAPVSSFMGSLTRRRYMSSRPKAYEALYVGRVDAGSSNRLLQNDRAASIPIDPRYRFRGWLFVFVHSCRQAREHPNPPKSLQPTPSSGICCHLRHGAMSYAIA
jgi:hypothetical protein